jgi:signal peptidase II
VDLRLPENNPVPPHPGNSSASNAATMVRRPAWTERVLAYRLLWVLAIALFSLDQITKTWIVAKLDYPTYWPSEGAITVISGFFYLVHVGNTGAAWSLFAGQSSLLALLAGITLVGIFFWRRHLGLRERRVQIAFGLLIGGIVGNFLDRVLHGHVIDFLDFHFGDSIYPTFNIADAGICVGVVLYLWHSFQEPAN